MNPERSPEPLNSLLQQPGPKKFKLFKIELIYKAEKFKVPPFTIYVKEPLSVHALVSYQVLELPLMIRVPVFLDGI